jgi:hypothetical protein
MVASSATPLDIVLGVATGGARRVGGQFLVHCPSHPDKHPSLAVRELGPGGKVLLHCHAGCRTEDVLTDLGLAFHDLYPDD